MTTKPLNIMISGSSKGLGKQLARHFQDLGLNVITMGFETPNTVDIRCDLLDLPALQVELKRAFDNHGEIDVLVCNAGTGKMPIGISSETKIREYFLEKNLETARNLVTAAIPYLKTPGASVVGISSIAALTEISSAPTGYKEAKSELNYFFRREALELAKSGIRMNLISPGNVMFPDSRWEEIGRENPEFVEKLLRDEVPLHEFISPEEIGSAILYLSSNEAKNITGNNLVIDGGQIL